MVLGLGVGESEAAGRPGTEVSGLGDRPYIVSVGRVDEHKGSRNVGQVLRPVQGAASQSLALVLVGPVSYELPAHPDIVVTGAVSESDKWDIVRYALRVCVAIGPRVVLSGGDRGLG